MLNHPSKRGSRCCSAIVVFLSDSSPSPSGYRTRLPGCTGPRLDLRPNLAEVGRIAGLPGQSLSRSRPGGGNANLGQPRMVSGRSWWETRQIKRVCSNWGLERRAGRPSMLQPVVIRPCAPDCASAIARACVGPPVMCAPQTEHYVCQFSGARPLSVAFSGNPR
jgi:hypothetical protein